MPINIIFLLVIDIVSDLPRNSHDGCCADAENIGLFCLLFVRFFSFGEIYLELRINDRQPYAGQIGGVFCNDCLLIALQ
jgi:hypothetical protein